jgi:triosephosphate isomerase (TIM)
MVKPTTSPRRPWVIGNWKMNGSMLDNEMLLSSFLGKLEAIEPAQPQAAAQCGVAVPFPYLFQAAVRLKGRGVDWGAQDVSAHAKGAFTGEVSVAMLADFEASFALVGHSERRAGHAESDEVVAQKACALLAAGMAPVICVGESLEIRDQGRARDHVCSQVRVVAQAAHAAGKLNNTTFAYEPIWAIGTGRSASPDQAQEIHSAIRSTLAEIDAHAAAAVRILYGGSVKAASAKELFTQEDIDGALVGGASLDAQEFFDIICAIKE